MRSGNPVLSERVFDETRFFDRTDTMTIEGTAMKTGILLVLCVITATFTWIKFMNGVQQGVVDPMVTWLMIGGAVGGLILALVTTFKAEWSPVTAPMYALVEGLFIGAISARFAWVFGEGIILQAVCLTFGTLFSLLIAYRSGWIRASENFKLGVVAATGGIFLIYMASWVLSLFSVSIPGLSGPGGIFGNGWIGIGFSLFVVVIAALNLVLDFDFIEHGAEQGAPKYMEWYGAFGLMVTLIWLYLEILRLLAKLQSDD